MKKWLLQTSTIGGLLGLALAGLKLYESGADPITIAIGIASAALLLINDGKFLKGLAPVLLLGFLATAPACTGLQLPSDISPSTIENVACNALFASQCFSDTLSTIGIRHDTCDADIHALIDGKISIDLSKVKTLPSVCKRDLKEIQKYIDTVKADLK